MASFKGNPDEAEAEDGGRTLTVNEGGEEDGDASFVRAIASPVVVLLIKKCTHTDQLGRHPCNNEPGTVNHHANLFFPSFPSPRSHGIV